MDESRYEWRCYSCGLTVETAPRRNPPDFWSFVPGCKWVAVECHTCATTATTHSTPDAVSLPPGWTLSNAAITTTVCRSCKEKP